MNDLERLEKKYVEMGNEIERLKNKVFDFSGVVQRGRRNNRHGI